MYFCFYMFYFILQTNKLKSNNVKKQNKKKQKKLYLIYITKCLQSIFSMLRKKVGQLNKRKRVFCWSIYNSKLLVYGLG